MNRLAVYSLMFVAGFSIGWIFLLPGDRDDNALEAGSQDVPKGALGHMELALRAGDASAAFLAMEELAKEDPRQFFKNLSRLPAIEGVGALVGTAARQLAKDFTEEDAELLNNVTNLDHRETAWIEILTSKNDLSTLEKIQLGRLAEPSSETVIYKGVVLPGMEKDPEGTLNTLMQASLMGPFCWAVGSLGNKDPNLAIAKLEEGMKSGALKPNASQLILETIAIGSPGNETLKKIADLVADYTATDGISVEPIFVPAFDSAGPKERCQVLDVISTLPAMQKNLVLSQLSYAGDMDVELLAKAINMMDSIELQRSVLSGWAGSGAGPDRLRKLSPLLSSEKARDLIGKLEKDALKGTRTKD